MFSLWAGVGHKGIKMQRINILFTSVGRRNVVINAFCSAAKKLKVDLGVFVLDHNRKYSSACRSGLYTDFGSPAYDSSEYPDFIIDLCRKYSINLVVPFMDGDLKPLAKIASELLSIGTLAVVSSEDTLEVTTGDKRKTHRFFQQHNIPCPKLIEIGMAINSRDFPVFMKPYDGIGSKFANRIDTATDAFYWYGKTPNPMVTEFIDGDEYTVDVYASLIDGRAKVAVPRRRLEVRSGEVNKAVVSRNLLVEGCAMDIVDLLPCSRGVMTLQCLVPKDGVPKFIEINARFGGGAPLSIQAGAHFPEWILREYTGKQIKVPRINDGLIMLRYEDAVFVK